MMQALAGILAAAAVLATAGIVEQQAHLRRLRRIPIRIHVNGMRGKSSTVRLIAAALRAGGIRAYAKTTGTVPRQILPDGSEWPVYRAARPNVIEQARMIAVAEACGAEAVVIECMALQPHLQALCELKLIRATHGVITNVGPDHLDVMGPGEPEVAEALAATVPVGAIALTGEQRHLATIAAAAADRGPRLVAVGAGEKRQVTAEELAGFGYVEHADNVALALAVCRELGIDRPTALAGMWRARPDAGAMTTDEVRLGERTIVFVNAFAANDPRSNEAIWQQALTRHTRADRRLAVVNCRADRALRSWQLGRTCAELAGMDHCLAIGTGTVVFARAARRSGLPVERLTVLGRAAPPEVLEALLAAAGRRTLVVGLGNTAGGGLELVRFLRRLRDREAGP